MTTPQLKGSPAQGLFGATAGFFVGFAAVALFGPTATRVKEAMDLSPFLVGLLIAMPSLSGSILRIPFSAWVDTTGGRKPFLTLLGLSVTGMVGVLSVIFFAYPDHMHMWLYPFLLLFGLLCGCGIASFSVGISQVSYWYPQKRQGQALATYAGVGNLAPGLFSFVLPVALASWGLSGSYLAWLLFLVAGLCIYAWTGRNAWYFQLRQQGEDLDRARILASDYGQELFPAGSFRETLGLSARIWKTWPLVGIYFTTFGGFIALTGWLPTYWEQYFALSGTLAGALTGLYSVLASAIRVPGGAVSDRLGGEQTVLLSLSVTIVGAALLMLSPWVALSITAVVLLAVGMGVANAAVFKLVPQEVPQAVGGAAGWVGGLGAFGGFAIPPVLGFFVTWFGDAGYAHGFVVFVLLAAASLGLGGVLKYSHRRLRPQDESPRPEPARQPDATTE